MMRTEDEWCKAIVSVRDTYRYTGRGKTGLELHYKGRRCFRKAGDNGYCYQHNHLKTEPDFAL